MRKTRFILAATVLAFLAGMVMLGRDRLGAQVARPVSRVTKPSPTDLTKTSKRLKRPSLNGGRIPLAEDDQPPAFCVVVDPTLNLTPDQQALYQQMATDLQDVAAIPNDRLNYYSAVNNPPNYVIRGWGGTVQNVQPDCCGGYLVTVFVKPHLSTTAYGNSTIILTSDYCEIYQVTNDVPQYVSFTDPAGLAGQMPDFLGL
jgi:hypothetical protein